MTEVLHAAVAPYVLLYTEGLGGQAHSDDEHNRMLDACRRSDSKASVKLLTKHLDGAANALGKYLQNRSLQSDERSDA